MITVELIKAVADELRDALKNTRLPSEHHSSRDIELKSVNVYEQQLPRELFNDDSYFPFVSVEWMSTSDALDGSNPRSTSQIGITIGVFAAEVWGYKDLLHILEIVRHRLLTRRLVAKKFRLTGDVNWSTPEEQPLPFMIAFGTLTYQNFLPVEASVR